MSLPKPSVVPALAAMLVCVLVAGCQPTGGMTSAADGLTTSSTKPPSFKDAAALSQAWQADPKNVNKGLAFANALDGLGQSQQQIAVLGKLSQDHPDDPRLATAYGRALIKAGQTADAIPVLEQSAARPGADWRVHNTLASAYDQQGQFEKAQSEYQAALKLQPNQLSVLNNMAMSVALHGDLKRAEQMLRSANALPGAASEPQLRQNLALVVGLQGRYDEARTIASKDLPPDQVEANLDYLRQMTAQQNTWNQLSSGNG